MSQKLKTRPWTFDGWVVNEVRSGIYTKYTPLLANDIVADVGAHIGAFTVIAAQKAALVYAFEPNTENFQLLRENVKSLGLDDRVTYENVAVSDRTGTASLRLCSWNTGGHTLGDEGVPVQTIKLDDRLSRLDFLKLDAEESEVKVLQGAKKLLAENNVRIAAEVHNRTLLEQAVQFLTSLGYTVMWDPYGLLYLLWAYKE